MHLKITILVVFVAIINYQPCESAVNLLVRSGSESKYPLNHPRQSRSAFDAQYDKEKFAEPIYLPENLASEAQRNRRKDYEREFENEEKGNEKKTVKRSAAHIDEEDVEDLVENLQDLMKNSITDPSVTVQEHQFVEEHLKHENEDHQDEHHGHVHDLDHGHDGDAIVKRIYARHEQVDHEHGLSNDNHNHLHNHENDPHIYVAGLQSEREHDNQLPHLQDQPHFRYEFYADDHHGHRTDRHVNKESYLVRKREQERRNEHFQSDLHVSPHEYEHKVNKRNTASKKKKHLTLKDKELAFGKETPIIPAIVGELDFTKLVRKRRSSVLNN